MDADKRIEELESQVKELTQQVRQLVNERSDETGPPEESATQAAAIKDRARQVFKADFQRNVDKVLGGEAGDTLETRIGGIWMSRIAVVIIMTALVLGARVTLYTDVFGPAQKVAITYAAAVCALIYGFLRRKSADFFPQTILGAGLAGIYFATYGAFFVEEMRVSPSTTPAVPLLLACLALLVIVSHRSRSQTVAGISLFLVYYTVVASCMGGRSGENIAYALLTCATLAVVALIFHALHRWLLFTWVALISTHLTYIFYFHAKPPDLMMSDLRYFWLSNGFLTVCYLAFSCASIIDARKTGEYRRTVAPMAGVNSFVYFCLMWIAIRQNYLEQEWMFRLAAAVALLVFAIFAETSGPKRNYLFQIFIAKTVIMFTLALQAYLAGATLMVAIAIECLALAFSYKRSGVVIFKILGILLLAVSFVGCLIHVKAPGTMDVFGRAIPANWFCCIGSALAFVMTSWFFERFVRRVKPEHRIVSGQWFMADTFVDVHSATAAMFYAAAAALTVLTVTIIDRGTDPNLPYLLAAEGVAMVLAGLALRTPQVQVGGVLLLVSCHVCFYTFLALGIPDFQQQAMYPIYTIIVALLTYMGAYVWERYLRRLKGGRPWEHDFLAALPYLAATFMLTTLAMQQLFGVHVPLAQNTLGVVLLLSGALLQLTGVRASGILAFGVGTATFYQGLFKITAPYAKEPYFLPYFLLVLISYVLAERLFVIIQHEEKFPSKTEDVLRTILVATATALGIIGLYLSTGTQYVTLHWLALAVAAVLLGAVFGESRYRWASMILFAVAIVRAFSYDLLRLPPVYQFLSFAALGAPLLVISWAYSRFRQRALKEAARDNPKETPPDE